MTTDELFTRIQEAVKGLQFTSEARYGATAWRPGPQPACRATQQPDWAGASAVEKREIMRRCAAPP